MTDQTKALLLDALALVCLTSLMFAKVATWEQTAPLFAFVVGAMIRPGMRPGLVQGPERTQLVERSETK